MIKKKGITSYQTFNDQESTYYMANHYPKGKLTGKRFQSESEIYKFILSLSAFVKSFVGDLYSLVVNRDIQKTDILLEDWETSVKIPLEIPRLDTVEKRRDAVECLISKIPVYNLVGVSEYKTTFEHHIRCLSGIDVEVRTKYDDTSTIPDYFVFIIGVPSELTEANQFPLAFPIQFTIGNIPTSIVLLLDTILERVIPSFCRWEYEVLV